MLSQSHIGKTCSYCQFPIKQDSVITVCPACKIPHHRDCWQSNNGCTTFACTGEAGLQDDDLDIKLGVNFDDKEWLIMRAGVLKGPYSRSELLAPSFLKSADKIFNRFTQQWASADDLTGSRLWSSEANENRLVVGTKQPVSSQQHKKSVLGLASVMISGVSALGSYIVFSNNNFPSIFQPTLLIIIGIIALGLGIAGLIQKEQEKVLPAMGSVVSFLLITAVMLQTGLYATPAVYALEIPEIATGPSSGVVEAEYRFSASKIGSLEGCNVEYCFAWGDGSETEWITNNTASKSWPNAGNYQVRVKARCTGSPDTETSWSPPVGIVVEAIAINMPETPILIAPANQSNINGKSIDFQWHLVDDAESYKLYVTRVSDGTAIIDQELIENFYTSSGFTDTGAEYQWSVCAGNSAGWSSWSTYWSFTNGSIPAPNPEPKPEPVRESEDIFIEWPPGSGNPPSGGTQPPQSSCTQQKSEQIARQFVYNCNTYRNIGSFNDIALINDRKLAGESAWQFTYTYSTGYPGHGFWPEGAANPAMVQQHTIIITVEKCKVTRAICCGHWDELNSKEL